VTIEPLYGRREQARPIASARRLRRRSVMQRAEYPDPAAAKRRRCTTSKTARPASRDLRRSDGAYGLRLAESEAAIARALERHFT